MEMNKCNKKQLKIVPFLVIMSVSFNMRLIYLSQLLHASIIRHHRQWLTTGRWSSPGLPISSTNKTDRHDITEILLKVALNTINQLNQPSSVTWLITLLYYSLITVRVISLIYTKCIHKYTTAHFPGLIQAFQ
jgi:hypothetical protein